MRLHIYDPKHTKKIGQLRSEDFTSIEVSKMIDDYESLRLVAPMGSKLAGISFSGMENWYLEDDDGTILFGGVCTGINITSRTTTLTCYDHRWVLSRLIIDSAKTLTNSDNVLEFIEGLLEDAKKKRNIPLVFNRAGSAINTDYRADLHFEVGESVGGCMQKIIQTIYARWAVRYTKVDNDIVGNLIVRSVRGVTPEGVGIARGIDQHKETDQAVHLIYAEGDQRSNVQDFNGTFDYSQMTTFTKVGAKIGGQSVFVNADPAGFSAAYEQALGRAEGFMTDYNANSEATAKIIGEINQTLPRMDFELQLQEGYNPKLNAGDRISVTFISATIEGVKAALMRVDKITYSRQDGYWNIRVGVNAMSPQKRAGSTGILNVLSQVDQNLDSLDKSYFNN